MKTQTRAKEFKEKTEDFFFKAHYVMWAGTQRGLIGRTWAELGRRGTEDFETIFCKG